MGRTLYDFKMLHFTPGTYTLRHVLRQDTHARPTLSPVDMRAHKVHSEYVAAARKLDRLHYSNIADADQRPVFKRLLEYGEVKGLAVGAFGGFSPRRGMSCSMRPSRVRRSTTGSWRGAH